MRNTSSSEAVYRDFVSDIPKFEPASGPPGYVYAKMADHIQLRIESGDLPVGARLPAERDLAYEYGVSTGTARRATAELRDRGLVITLPMKGTYVTERQQNENSSADSRDDSA